MHELSLSFSGERTEGLANQTDDCHERVAPVLRDEPEGGLISAEWLQHGSISPRVIKVEGDRRLVPRVGPGS